MFRESLVDAALNRLSGHFAARLLVHPPASAEMLAELESVAGPLPREFTIFLATCNGLRIRGAGSETELHLWGAREILAALTGDAAVAAPQGLLPIHGGTTGERDWLMSLHGLAEGAVIRWDPWTPGAELVASCFGAYLAGWVDYLLRRYTPDGSEARPGEAPLPFDARLCEPYDDQITALRRDPRVHEMLLQIDHAVACGDDFE
ncbi:MAG: SMI1/KNR4 family protein [Planctomycetes bacterium]|nr:SMI1/KNR4 family protein [Planctomycetota bacterium]